MDSHGGWIAAAEDLTKFGSALYNPEQGKILSKRAIEAMFSPPEYLDLKPARSGALRYYAAGWRVVRSPNGSQNEYHGGALKGISAALVRRGDQFCWAILFNCDKTPDDKLYLESQIDSPMHKAINATLH